MGSLIYSARASGIFLTFLNLYHHYNAFSSPANCCGVRASQLLVTQNGRVLAIQRLVTQNCGVPAIQLLVTLKKHPHHFFSQQGLRKKMRRIREGSLNIFLPLLPFTLTETVPQLFSVGFPTVFLPAVPKSVVTAVTNGFLPPVRWINLE